MQKPIRIMIAESHKQVRTALSALLALEKNVQLVGEAQKGKEVLNGVAEHKPDIVLLDADLPGLKSANVLSQLAKKHPTVKVIMLVSDGDPQRFESAKQEGVKGWLSTRGLLEMAMAIRNVQNGKPCGLIGDVQDRSQLPQAPRSTASRSPIAKLTPRQTEVLKLIADGYSTAEVATHLGVSIKTAETHRAQMMSRLDMHKVADLVRYAIRIGLVSADS